MDGLQAAIKIVMFVLHKINDTAVIFEKSTIGDCLILYNKKDLLRAEKIPNIQGNIDHSPNILNFCSVCTLPLPRSTTQVG